MAALRRRTGKRSTDKTSQREHTGAPEIPLARLRRSRLITLCLRLPHSRSNTHRSRSPLTIVSVARPSAACPRISRAGKPSTQASRSKRAGRRGSSPRGEAAEINVGDVGPGRRDVRPTVRVEQTHQLTRIDFTRGHRKWRCTVARSSSGSSNRASARSARSLARSLPRYVAPPGPRLRFRRTPPGAAARPPRWRATFESRPIVESVLEMKNYFVAM